MCQEVGSTLNTLSLTRACSRSGGLVSLTDGPSMIDYLQLACQPCARVFVVVLAVGTDHSKNVPDCIGSWLCADELAVSRWTIFPVVSRYFIPPIIRVSRRLLPRVCAFVSNREVVTSSDRPKSQPSSRQTLEKGVHMP